MAAFDLKAHSAKYARRTGTLTLDTGEKLAFKGQAKTYTPDGLANLAEKSGVNVTFVEVVVDGLPYKEKAKYEPGVRALEAVLGAMGQEFDEAANETATPKLATA